MTRWLRSCALLSLATSVLPFALRAQSLTFSTPKQFTVTLPDSAGVAHFSAADFNGDGKMDYLLEAWNQGDLLDFALLFGNGYGSFTQQETNVPVTPSLKYVAADVNNDGKTDIITFEAGCEKGAPCNSVSNENNPVGAVKVYVNQGGGKFTNTYNGTLPARGTLNYVAADFNGDGKPDFAVLASTGDPNTVGTAPQLLVFLNQGNGVFTEHTYTNLPSVMTTEPTSIGNLVVGNFTGNGRKDLLFSFTTTNTDPASYGQVYIIPNNGYGSFGTPQWVYTLSIRAPANFIFGDVNGDGLTDLLYLDGSIKDAVTLRAISGGGFTKITAVHYYMDYPYQWAFADLNGDGKLDLTINGTSGSTQVPIAATYPGYGDGTFNSSYKAFHPGGGGGPSYLQIAPLIKGSLPSVMFQTGSNSFELYINTTKK